jgi:hypothetical protein
VSIVTEHRNNHAHNQPENGFVEGNHPEAYDFRGNFNGNLPEEAPEQAHTVPAETAGYQAPGGGVRRSIRDRIASVRPYKSEIVNVPEWDGVDIEVRSVTLGERQEIMAEIMDEEGNAPVARIMSQFIIACSFDPETGEKVFSHDDEEFVNSRAAGPADKIGTAAMKLSGMGKAMEDEEAKKSSLPGTSGSNS